MLAKPIDQVTLADVQALLGTAQENKTLEFKRQIAPGPKGELALLAGISAMANTAGGDFLIGVDAKDGVAVSAPGIAIENLDREKQRLENLLGSCIEPRLPRIDLHPILCGDGCYILLFRVPFSWNGPHRVTRDSRFYGRTSATTYPLDVPALRAAFTQGSTIAERIRAFRAQRLAKIGAGETPVQLTVDSSVVLHLIPAPPIANGESIDVMAGLERGHHFPLPPGGDGFHKQPGVNLDGVFNDLPNANGGSLGYAQVLRNGSIEGVRSMSIDGGPYLAELPFANLVMAATRQYLSVINDQNFGFPIYVMLSLVCPDGCVMRYPTEMGVGYYATKLLEGPVVAFPEVVIDHVHSDLPDIMRPMMNMVWNAFGHAKCNIYDGTGAWKGG